MRLQSMSPEECRDPYNCSRDHTRRRKMWQGLAHSSHKGEEISAVQRMTLWKKWHVSCEFIAGMVFGDVAGLRRQNNFDGRKNGNTFST